MFSKKRDLRLPSITGIWLLFAFTAFLRLASAASLPPQQLLGNGIFPATNEPGIGVEIEMGKITITKTDNMGKSVDLTREEKEKAKGADMIPTGFVGDAKTNWRLTADIGATTGLFPEAIVDGLKNKVGNKNTKVIGAEIYKFFQDWAPCRECANSKVTIEGLDSVGSLSVFWPKTEAIDLSDPKFTFASQVTTAMPLQAVLDILGDAANKNQAKNPLASSGAINAGKIKILKKEDFVSFKKIKQADINDEFLGYFSLLTSYCILADASNKKEGAKRILPIMPRTDFVTQYNTFVEPKLRAQLAKNRFLPDTSLYDIIEKVSGEPTGTLGQKKFVWNNKVTTEIEDDWVDKAKDLQDGTLEVQKFIKYIEGYDWATKKAIPQKDLVKLMDKTLRHGQIGGLGSRMENLYQTTSLIPIFEFRELDNILGADLENTLEKYEDKVIEYHTSIIVREDEL